MLRNKLLQSTAVVGSLTLLSRILGFIRDIVIAYAFGAGASADAFLVAFKIPNFMRRLFAEGAFAQAFTPVLGEYKAQRDKAEVKQLIDHVAGSLGGLLLLITLLGVIAAPLFVMLFAPGFMQYAEKFDLTVEMLRITFPYLWFIALTAFAGSVLNTYGRFAIPAFTPVLLNICLISAALWLTHWFTENPIKALAWGVLAAGIAQLCFQLPFLARLGLLPRPRFNLQHPGVQRIHALMLPALFGVSVSQINLLIDTLMASFLTTGSITWLYFSDRVMEFPVGVFGLALATVTLPSLAKHVALQDERAYQNTIDWALRWVFLIGAPAMTGLIILSGPILTTLFHFDNGAFGDHDVLMSQQSLIAYSLGLLGFVLIKVLASAFYARQNTKTPVKVAVIAMVVNMGLNLLFIVPLQHAGLALATACAALVNAGLLYHNLRQQQVFTPLPGWRLFLLQVSASCLAMLAVINWGAEILPMWFAAPTLTRIYWLGLWIGLGMLIYVVSLFALGFRLRHIRLHTGV